MTRHSLTEAIAALHPNLRKWVGRQSFPHRFDTRGNMRIMSAHPDYVPIDRDDLLARIALAWDEMDAIVSPITAERLSRVPTDGGWTIRDHLAHVATWLRVAVARIEQRPEHAIFGLDPVSYRASNGDALNDAGYRLHRDQSTEEVLADLWEMHARVVAVVRRADSGELDRPTWPDAPHRGPLSENIHGNTANHYHEHTAAIKDILGQI